MSHITELEPSLLWAGDDNFNAYMIPASVVRVVSVMASRPTLGYGGRAWIWLPATDDAPISPAAIDVAVMDKRVPTLVHCHLGQNRSTAIAVCWYRRHYLSGVFDGTLWQTKLDRMIADIEARRTCDLVKIGRSRAEVSPAMRKNIHDYHAWLLERGL